MKHNTAEVAKLQPDYLGFIFYKKSARDFNTSIPNLPSSIKKVGVFVDEDIELIIEKIDEFNLQAIQLHGHESPEYCAKLKRHYIKDNDKTLDEPGLKDVNLLNQFKKRIASK